ncbi:hypothetical protein OHC33_011258, partial [Knufia fluminis]
TMGYGTWDIIFSPLHLRPCDELDGRDPPVDDMSSRADAAVIPIKQKLKDKTHKHDLSVPRKVEKDNTEVKAKQQTTTTQHYIVRLQALSVMNVGPNAVYDLESKHYQRRAAE